MKKICFGLVLLIFYCLSFYNFAAGRVAGQSMSLRDEINALLAKVGEDLNIGIVVKEINSGKSLYERNPNRYFMPASNEKLFTALAALHYLGTNFTYPTRLFIDPDSIEKEVLRGNIYFQFNGDPTLSLEHLEELINPLVTRGIKKVTGRIVLDDTLFDQMSQSPGTSWDDRYFCWGAPVHAAIINNNCVSAQIKPTIKGQLAQIELPYYPQSMRFINQIITQSKQKKDCMIKIKTSHQAYRLEGCINENAPPRKIVMAIDNPRYNSQLMIAYLLKKKKIHTFSKPQFGKLGKNLSLLAEHKSAPLPDLITKMLKDSDNTIADSLFKTLGALYARSMGSYSHGSNAVRTFLNKSMQFNFPNSTLIDGSGGSRYDFVTPQQIVRLLEFITTAPTASYFINFLPVSGVDGTLKDRMKDPSLAGKVYAKTGSMTGVSSLAGILETRSRRRLLFSIMINGFVDSSKKYKELEDNLCKLLVDHI